MHAFSLIVVSDLRLKYAPVKVQLRLKLVDHLVDTLVVDIALILLDSCLDFCLSLLVVKPNHECLLSKHLTGHKTN